MQRLFTTTLFNTKVSTQLFNQNKRFLSTSQNNTFFSQNQLNLTQKTPNYSLKNPNFLPQRRQFSNEAMKPNAEPYNPYPNQTIPQEAPISTTTPIKTATPTTPQQPPQPTQFFNQPLPTPPKPHFFNRNPWLLPQIIVTAPLIGIIIYQQLLINEIVSHTQAVESAVEQFGDILEYHHNVLGQIVEFPEQGGPDGPFMGNPNQNQPPVNSQPPQGRIPYQPRSGLFPGESPSGAPSTQGRDQQRVPSGYPFNQ
jgi:hypothetical protein